MRQQGRWKTEETVLEQRSKEGGDNARTEKMKERGDNSRTEKIEEIEDRAMQEQRDGKWKRQCKKREERRQCLNKECGEGKRHY